jgi:hypothetical protein
MRCPWREACQCAFCIQWLVNGSDTSIAEQTSRVASMFLYGAMGGATPSPKTTRSRQR